MTLFQLFFLFLSIFISIAFASRNEVNRNILHFSNNVGWQGPPAALYNKDNTLRLYYEQPLDTDQVTGTAQMKWAQASTKDGISWKDEDTFVKETAGSSCKGTSYYQGGMINWKYPNIGLGKGAELFAMLHHYCPVDQKHSIRNRFTLDGITSSLSKNGGLLIENKIAADGFEFNGQTYLAAIGPDSCNIEFFRIPGTTHSSGGQQYIDYSPANNFSTGLSGSCRGIQIHPLSTGVWIVSLSHTEGALLSTQTKYWYGKFTVNGSYQLTFTPESYNGNAGPYILDYGHDAQDFKFSTLNGKTVAIGWNGNQLYADKYPQNGWKNSVTVPRYINGATNGRLIQEPISFASKGIKTNIKFNKGKDLTLGTKSCYSSHDLSSVESKKDGVFIFDLEFKHKNEFKQAGFKIEFQTAKSQDVLAVSFNKAFSGTVADFQLTVDRSETDLSWGAKNNVASASVGTLLSVPTMSLTIILDKSTIEVYGLGGRLVLTESYFLKSKTPFSKMCIQAINDNNNVIVTAKSSYGKYSSIWTKTTPTTKPPSSAALSLPISFVVMFLLSSSLSI